MDAEQRIKRLEERIAYLTAEKNTAAVSMELAASLGNFSSSLNKLESPSAILEEFATKLTSLLKMEALSIYKVSEEDSDLHQVYCYPHTYHGYFEHEIDALINNNTLAWALGRRKPLTLLSTEKDAFLLLHSLNTASRTRGIVIGKLRQPAQEILDVTFSLVTILCNAAANLLESYELYQYIRNINKELETNVERLRESRFEIMQHRNKLQGEVARQTKDLVDANEQLKGEIRKRLRIEKYLVKERDFISAVLETTAALVLVLNPKGLVERCNKACEMVSGYPARDVLGMPFWKISALPEEREKAQQEFFQYSASSKGTAFERYMRTSQGVRQCVSWTTTAIVDKKGELEFIIATGIDITEKKRTEEALRDAEAMYRHIFEQAAEGIFLASAGGELIKANPALAHMLGYEDPAELAEAMRTNTAVYTHPNVKKKIMELLVRQNKLASFVFRVRHKDGRNIWVVMNAQVVRDKDGSVIRFEGIINDITEQMRSRRHWQRLATMDDLTGIPNRYLFMDRFEQMLAQAKRLDHSFVLLYMDLDFFKDVNDVHGHHVGDLLLQEVASRLRSRIRKSDTVARLGGDEFTVLLYNMKRSCDLEKVILEIIDTLRQPYYIKKKKCVIGVSVGISMFPCDGRDSEELLKKADKALYAAKNGGRNAFRYASEFCRIDAEKPQPAES